MRIGQRFSESAGKPLTKLISFEVIFKLHEFIGKVIVVLIRPFTTNGNLKGIFRNYSYLIKTSRSWSYITSTASTYWNPYRTLQSIWEITLRTSDGNCGVVTAMVGKFIADVADLAVDVSLTARFCCSCMSSCSACKKYTVGSVADHQKHVSRVRCWYVKYTITFFK